MVARHRWSVVVVGGGRWWSDMPCACGGRQNDSDVWSLGIALVELLLGCFPYCRDEGAGGAGERVDYLMELLDRSPLPLLSVSPLPPSLSLPLSPSLSLSLSLSLSCGRFLTFLQCAGQARAGADAHACACVRVRE